MSTSRKAEPVLLAGISEVVAERSVVSRSGSLWAVLIVSTGWLASLAWTGVLVWCVGRFIEIW